MSCLNPILIKVTDSNFDSSLRKVPCRECEECKNLLRNAAFVRLKYEYDECMRQHGMCFFFTLTFADEYVPFKFHRMCFDKKLVQRWLQSFRQTFRRKYGYSLKYFIVSELGHVGTFRPHHHGALFLYPDKRYQLKSWQENGKHHHEIPFFAESYCAIIRNLWNFGRADVQVLDPSKGGFRYVSKYMSKDNAEQNLFKDIITRIQMKRGKADCVLSEHSVDRWKYLPKDGVFFRRSPYSHNEYLEKTFPALYAFRNRYCPFTMISKELGSTAPITEEMIETVGNISIDGFVYSIPRYYVDRYVRKECLAAIETFTCKSDFSDVNFEKPNFVSNRFRKVYDPTKNCVVISKGLIPIDSGNRNVLPSQRVLEKYKVFDSLFDYHYENVPLYRKQFNSKGEVRLVKDIPIQSKGSILKYKRQFYQLQNLYSLIEDKYFNLPPLLQDSCIYDIPKLLRDSSEAFGDLKKGEYVVPTPLYFSMLEHLDELCLTHSQWRAKSRIDRMAQKRKDKCNMNVRHCKAPLTWDEYKSKSRYFQTFLKH